MTRGPLNGHVDPNLQIVGTCPFLVSALVVKIFKEPINASALEARAREPCLGVPAQEACAPNVAMLQQWGHM